MFFIYINYLNISYLEGSPSNLDHLSGNLILLISREIFKFKIRVQILKMIEYVWSVNIMVLLLLGGVGYGLYLIFTMDSPEFESKNIDLKDIGHNH